MTIDPPGSRFDLRHAASDRASFVVVGPRRFFAIEGSGPPTASDFRIAFEPLRANAERLGTVVRARLSPGEREVEPPSIPECLWWRRDVTDPDDLLREVEDRSRWSWRQLVEISRWATEAEASDSIATVARSAGRSAPLVRVAEMSEGRAAQILHRGGSGTIGPTLRRLYSAIAAAGETPGGTIHELRVADERIVPAERAHLILRVPLEPLSTH